MEWTESLRTAVDFMERNLMNEIDAEDVAKEVHISSFYLQRGFKFMTGYSIGEYIRCRRLSTPRYSRNGCREIRNMKLPWELTLRNTQRETAKIPVTKVKFGYLSKGSKQHPDWREIL